MHALLPKLLRDHSAVLIETPLRILAIVVGALIIRAVVRRLIERIMRPAVDGAHVPQALRPLRDRIQDSGLLESTGLISERRRQRAATLSSVLRSAASVTIFVIASLLILSELRIDLAPFIAGTSIIGVALGFGAQNVVKDFFSGMFMLMEDQYGVGDVIDFEKASGTVEGVGLRTTRLRDVNGTVWYVRNGEVVRVGNKSQGFAQVVLDVPIDAATDVDDASATMLATAQQMVSEPDWADVFLGPPEVQGVESLTREETVIRLVAKVRPLEQWRTARELRRRIRDQLDDLDIDAQPPVDVNDTAPRA